MLLECVCCRGSMDASHGPVNLTHGSPAQPRYPTQVTLVLCTTLLCCRGVFPPFRCRCCFAVARSYFSGQMATADFLTFRLKPNGFSYRFFFVTTEFESGNMTADWWKQAFSLQVDSCFFCRCLVEC